MKAVSYTHLDVYKRQTQGRVRGQQKYEADFTFLLYFNWKIHIYDDLKNCLLGKQINKNKLNTFAIRVSLYNRTGIIQVHKLLSLQ